MCTNPIGFQKKENSPNYSFRRIIHSIKKNNRTGTAGDFHISGGEPTIHPDFFGIVRYLRSISPNAFIYILTNGRMFYYKEFVRKVLAFNKIFLVIPVFGHNARLHDRITRINGSFKQTISGIRCILKNRRKGQKLEIRVVLVRQNFMYLGKIVEFIHRNFDEIDNLVLIFPEPEGRCEADFGNIGLTYSEVKDIIGEVVLKWKDRFRSLRIYHFPLCTIDRRLWPYSWITQNPQETAYAPQCRKCRLRNYCPRIHRNYLKITGDREFIAQLRDVKVKLNKPRVERYGPIREVL
jgi:MoaA/NifB/PqqE/SkfB family radical SAM enzyme